MHQSISIKGQISFTFTELTRTYMVTKNMFAKPFE